jgi:Domain of unknown function (DUF2019)
MLKKSALVQNYIQAARAHGLAKQRGDYKEANRQHDRIIRALKGLRALPEGEQEALLGMLSDDDVNVRAWAATYLLFLAPDKAVPVLEEVAAAPGVLGFGAEVTLREFRKGTLKLL